MKEPLNSAIRKSVFDRCGPFNADYLQAKWGIGWR